MAKLYIVGTPIGNLEDITLRALRILKKVDYIACEDTRVTKKLLNHFEIKNKKLLVHNNINEKKSVHGIIKLIKNEKNVAQVSDAGLPTINDPGYILIRGAIENEIDIEIIPGISAVTVASVLANFDIHFSFGGFFKFKTEQRKNQLRNLKSGTHIFFASPHRIENELADIKEVFGENIEVFLGRELTKKFESIYRGTIKEVIALLDKNYKGEFTVVISVPKEVKNDK